MFRAGLLLIIRRYYTVYTSIDIVKLYVDWLLAGSEWARDIYQLLHIRSITS